MLRARTSKLCVHKPQPTPPPQSTHSKSRAAAFCSGVDSVRNAICNSLVENCTQYAVWMRGTEQSTRGNICSGHLSRRCRAVVVILYATNEPRLTGFAKFNSAVVRAIFTQPKSSRIMMHTCALSLSLWFYSCCAQNTLCTFTRGLLCLTQMFAETSWHTSLRVIRTPSQRGDADTENSWNFHRYPFSGALSPYSWCVCRFPSARLRNRICIMYTRSQSVSIV